MKWYAGIGSRETPPEKLLEMRFIAERLESLDFVLRSGNADGADQAFQSGAGKNLAVYLPWPGYNGYTGPTIYPSERAIGMAMAFHSAPWHLTQGAEKLHGRNMHIILGSELRQPVSLVVCWTKDGKEIGGTATGIRCALKYGIPVFNLARYTAREVLEEYLNG